MTAARMAAPCRATLRAEAERAVAALAAATGPEYERAMVVLVPRLGGAAEMVTLLVAAGGEGPAGAVSRGACRPG